MGRLHGVEPRLRGLLAGAVVYLAATAVATLVAGRAPGPSAQAVQLAHTIVGLAVLPLAASYVVVHLAQVFGTASRAARRGTAGLAACLAWVVTFAVIGGLDLSPQVHHAANLVFVAGFVAVSGLLVVQATRVVRASAARALRSGTFYLVASFLAAGSGVSMLSGGDHGTNMWKLHVGASAVACVGGIVHLVRGRRASAAAGAREYPWSAPLQRITVPVLGALTVATFAFGRAVVGGVERPPPAEGAIVAADRGFAAIAPDGCGGCHASVGAGWSASSHAHAAANPVFTALVRRLADEGRTEDARQCLRCHAPHALDPTRADIPAVVESEGYRAGVHCLTCHRMAPEPDSADGQFDVRPLALDGPLALTEHTGPSADRLRAIPAAQASLLAGRLPTHLAVWRQAPSGVTMCRPCHVQTLAHPTRGAIGQPIQDQAESWLRSPAARAGIGCVDCHMPRYFGEEDDELEDHRFHAASTYVARLAGGAEAEANVVSFLAGAWSPPVGTRALGPPRATGPLLDVSVERATGPRGEPALRVTTRNTGRIGHDFPNAPSDLVECWLSIRATDAAGQVVLERGTRAPDEELRLGHRFYDAAGRRIDDHRLWAVARVDDRGRIPEEGDHVLELPLAAEASPGPLAVVAEWSYRRLPPTLVASLAAPVEGLPTVSIARTAVTLE